MRLVVVSVVLSLVAGCRKEAAPLPLEQLIPPVGAIVPAFCTKAIDGKRFVLDGVLQLPTPAKVDEHDLVDLDFYAGVDGERRPAGRSISVSAKNGKHLDDLSELATDVQPNGFRQTKGVLPPDALKVRAAGGEELHALEPASVTIEVEVLTKFQSDEVSACVYHFVEAKKR